MGETIVNISLCPKVGSYVIQLQAFGQQIVAVSDILCTVKRVVGKAEVGLHQEGWGGG